MTEPKETTRERFDRQVRELGGEPAYGEWLGTKKPHRVICKEGHEGSPRPGNVRRGQGICNICAGNDPYTAEQNFIRRVKELGGEPVYDEWLNNRTPHSVICKESHECNPIPRNIQQGQGICRICAGQDPYTAEQNFIRRVKELGGEPAYDAWRGANIGHRVICKSGHECSPRPADVQRGRGLCRICAGNDPYTAEQNFIARVTALGGTPAYEEWLGVMKPHPVICKEGHECNPAPASVQQGGGLCRICRGCVFDCFYVVRNPHTYVAKFGITSGDPRHRLSRHKYAGYTEQLYLKTGFEGAGPLEDAVKIALADAGYEPVQGREYFRDDCLPYLMSLLPDVD